MRKNEEYEQMSREEMLSRLMEIASRFTSEEINELIRKWEAYTATEQEIGA